MCGAPKGARWFTTPNRDRKRKRLEVTLSPEALTALDELTGPGGSKSAVIERLILEKAKST